MSLKAPSGYSFVPAPRHSWDSAQLDTMLDKLIIWEAPRADSTYVVGVDTGMGLGQDRTVAEVFRSGTLEEPDEQVAQFITESVGAIEFAPYLNAIGRFYADGEGLDALLAIECNAAGIGTQSELQGHYGYSNFFVWEYYDARNPAARFSQRFGWYTSNRTRPEIISRLHKALNTYVMPDPENPARKVRAPQPELILNSPFTLDELQDFQVAYRGAPISTAEASRGTHDDSIMACAIAFQVCQRRHFLEREPLNEQRRRYLEDREAQDLLSARLATKRDWQNTDATATEMKEGYDTSDEVSDWETTL
jgi:hypothetical protein